jgi:RHS repeat-associated protein
LNYTYDGDGDRLQKSNGKIYWYGAGSQILDESDASGNITDEYIYFAGKRIAHRVVSSNTFYFYVDDLLGSSRALATSAGAMCFDADFYPYGGEHDYTNTCPQNYKFTGKERDPETNNDDFDARYYSSAYGRFLSADWSSTPSPVPYANLTNPQTLNLYAMVSDNPESFADLGGHVGGIGGPEILFAGQCENPPCTQQSGTNAGTAQNQTLNLNAAVTGPTNSSGGTIVQSPTFLNMVVTSDSLAPGTYQVSVSVTKVTTDKDNNQPVTAAQITTKVDDIVQHVAGKLVGSEGTQPGTGTKFSLVVGISAKNGDFHYDGDAKVNVSVAGPNGARGGFSVPVDMQRGGTSAPSVVGVSGGRTSFTIPAKSP